MVRKSEGKAYTFWYRVKCDNTVSEVGEERRLGYRGMEGWKDGLTV